MKKLFTFIVLVAIAGFTGWQNRVELLVWGAPKLLALTTPIAENRTLEWSQGPDTAVRAMGHCKLPVLIA